MLLRIQHETRFTYTAPVTETVFEVRMAPQSDEDQTALRYRLQTTPQAPVTAFHDGFGNRVDLFNIAKPYHELIIRSTSFVRTHRRQASPRLLEVSWPPSGPYDVDAAEFLLPSPLVDASPALDAFLGELPRPTGDAMSDILALVSAVRDRFKYEKRVTGARTLLSEALEGGKGVCQDFAHLFIGACRGLGIPARYVSGYVNHPGEIATHAWCQIWGGDGVGWFDVDPTAGEFASDDYVVIAFGRDYSDVPPNRGVWKGKAEEQIAVTVGVEPVDRLPFEWNEWTFPVPADGQSQYQRQGSRSSQMQRQSSRAAFPDQPRPRAELHQQQGQQQ
ncbi:transglutaminase family protein [Tautonia plasticadhaerens]|uniref:Transglutaminase-like superfamily protein n=1 Tax=Tautonia plasticadhaerens TaxID=2527974 RepID=A0A518GVN6_9BACT|nr:transglutaminase family protein [Tautonia plasticadhaerens]QDV32665.1 Transglutaminase-like superfamily protein [Tautonia plasticadhaerens]